MPNQGKLRGVLAAAVTRRLREVYGERVDGIVESTVRHPDRSQPHVVVTLPWDMATSEAEISRVAGLIGEVTGRTMEAMPPPEWVCRRSPETPPRARVRFEFAVEATRPT